MNAARRRAGVWLGGGAYRVCLYAALLAYACTDSRGLGEVSNADTLSLGAITEVATVSTPEVSDETRRDTSEAGAASSSERGDDTAISSATTSANTTATTEKDTNMTTVTSDTSAETNAVSRSATRKAQRSISTRGITRGSHGASRQSSRSGKGMSTFKKSAIIISVIMLAILIIGGGLAWKFWPRKAKEDGPPDNKPDGIKTDPNAEVKPITGDTQVTPTPDAEVVQPQEDEPAPPAAEEETPTTGDDQDQQEDDQPLTEELDPNQQAVKDWDGQGSFQGGQAGSLYKAPLVQQQDPIPQIWGDSVIPIDTDRHIQRAIEDQKLKITPRGIDDIYGVYPMAERSDKDVKKLYSKDLDKKIKESSKAQLLGGPLNDKVMWDYRFNRQLEGTIWKVPTPGWHRTVVRGIKSKFGPGTPKADYKKICQSYQAAIGVPAGAQEGATPAPLLMGPIVKAAAVDVMKDIKEAVIFPVSWARGLNTTMNQLNARLLNHENSISQQTTNDKKLELMHQIAPDGTAIDMKSMYQLGVSGQLMAKEGSKATKAIKSKLYTEEGRLKNARNEAKKTLGKYKVAVSLDATKANAFEQIDELLLRKGDDRPSEEEINLLVAYATQQGIVNTLKKDLADTETLKNVGDLAYRQAAHIMSTLKSYGEKPLSEQEMQNINPVFNRKYLPSKPVTAPQQETTAPVELPTADKQNYPTRPEFVSYADMKPAGLRSLTDTMDGILKAAKKQAKTQQKKKENLTAEGYPIQTPTIPDLQQSNMPPGHPPIPNQQSIVRSPSTMSAGPPGPNYDPQAFSRAGSQAGSQMSQQGGINQQASFAGQSVQGGIPPQGSFAAGQSMQGGIPPQGSFAAGQSMQGGIPPQGSFGGQSIQGGMPPQGSFVGQPQQGMTPQGSMVGQPQQGMTPQGSIVGQPQQGMVSQPSVQGAPPQQGIVPQPSVQGAAPQPTAPPAEQ